MPGLGLDCVLDVRRLNEKFNLLTGTRSKNQRKFGDLSFGEHDLLYILLTLHDISPLKCKTLTLIVVVKDNSEDQNNH